jgi:DNA repair protein RecO (recombination protein O)
MEQTEAILIRKTSWSDTSLIVTWFTAGHGKLTTIARAARRAGSPFCGRLDLFHRVEIGFLPSRRSEMHTLREVRMVDAFSSTSAVNVFLCGYFAELVDLVTQIGEPFPEIYNLLARASSHLSRSPATPRALEFFEDELCRVLGVYDDTSCALVAIETYCGRIPASRMPAVKMLSSTMIPQK